MSGYDVILRGGDAVLPGVGRRAVDVAVADGRIAALFAPGTEATAKRVLDVHDRVVLPGGVDAHVHLGHDIQAPRTPPEASNETASAVAGGVTTMLSYLMSPEPFEPIHAVALELMSEHSYTDFGFHFCLVTPDQVRAVPKYIEDLGVSSFKFFMNFRGDEGAYLGLPGNDDGFLFDLLRTVAANGGMANPHAENIELVWRLREELEQASDAGLDAWNALRPDFVEAEAEQRVAYLASVVGASMYGVHVTSQAALKALAHRRAQHPDVFIETCPHYLTLDQSSPLGSRGKVNPPLRTADDREALWSAVADGTIDVIGSDHVPRHHDAKDKDLWSASAGFPGTGTMLPLMISEGHVKRGVPLERMVSLLSTRPAQLFGMYPRKGAILPGADADLTVLDLSSEQVVTAETQHSGAAYSVWEGWTIGCRVEHTLVRGHLAVVDGKLQEPRGAYVPRTRSGRAALDEAGVA